MRAVGFPGERPRIRAACEGVLHERYRRMTKILLGVVLGASLVLAAALVLDAWDQGSQSE